MDGRIQCTGDVGVNLLLPIIFPDFYLGGIKEILTHLGAGELDSIDGV